MGMHSMTTFFKTFDSTVKEVNHSLSQFILKFHFFNIQIEKINLNLCCHIMLWYN